MQKLLKKSKRSVYNYLSKTKFLPFFILYIVRYRFFDITFLRCMVLIILGTILSVS